jgi:hypothetical protein
MLTKEDYMDIKHKRDRGVYIKDIAAVKTLDPIVPRESTKRTILLHQAFISDYP